MSTASRRSAIAAVALLLLVSDISAAQSSWTLSNTPTVRIDDDGSAARNFANIVGVRRLDDGRIVVAENRSSELRVFTKNGALERIATRSGEGPNELGAVAFVETTSQALIAFDGQRTVWLTPDSIREFRREPYRPSARLRAMGAMGNGTIWGSKGAQGRAITQIVSGLRRDSLEIVVFNRTSDAAAYTTGKRLGRSFLTIKSSTVVHGFRGSMTRFAPQLLLAGAHDVLWFGDSGSGSVSYIDARSGRTTTHTLPIAVVPWNTRALEAERVRIMRTISAPADRELPLAELEPQWRGSTRPVYSELYPDVNNGVWIELFDESATARKAIMVLSAQGQVLARLTLPAGLKVWEIGRDFVLGEARDADGLSSVVQYRLDRR